jgi:hypothetical protein
VIAERSLVLILEKILFLLVLITNPVMIKKLRELKMEVERFIIEQPPIKSSHMIKIAKLINIKN